MTRNRILTFVALVAACAVASIAWAVEYVPYPQIFTSDVTVRGTFTAAGAVATTGSVSDSDSAYTIADNCLVDGAADVVQFTVQGHSTQTSSLAVFENSGGTDQVTISNAGVINALGIPVFPTGGVTLGSTTITEAEAGALDSVVAGTAAANKAVVLDANLRIDDLDVTALEIGNVDITATGTEINTLAGVTGGTAAASKAVVLNASTGVSGLGIVGAAHYRSTIAAAATAAAVDLTPALFRASGVFLADTTANTIDFEVDGALDAADLGTVKHFIVTVGGTNAITFSADGAGVTSVVDVQQGAGASCEDVGDMIRVTVTGTGSAIAETFCAD